ncbi:MAG TPA: GNAT family N-acetyltransferase [Verrucomicrobiae bacterium]|nr:GNAT family N-acetyltransferase [Verrucomicrobiae bacterium]
MIRIAEDSDIPKIEQLMRSEPGFWNDRWPEDALRTAIKIADGLALVWEEQGKILGFVCAHNLGFRGYLNELIVSKEARGKNIGSELLKPVEKELRSQGCPVVISDVWKTAEPFYRKMGWSSPDVILLAKRTSK